MPETEAGAGVEVLMMAETCPKREEDAMSGLPVIEWLQ